MKKKKHFLSIILSLALSLTILLPSFAQASEIPNQLQSDSEYANEHSDSRKNLHFIEGKLGDSHIVYTYEENSKQYKAIETSSDDFKSATSMIYCLNEAGNYILQSTQNFSIDDNGNPEILITTKDGDNKYQKLNLEMNEENGISLTGEWATHYYNGSKGGLKGLALSVLVSVVAAVATYYTAGALSTAMVSGASTIATALFNRNSSVVYYHLIRNTRISPKNNFVIDETNYTTFYLDSTHKYSLGSTYAEYIF